MGDMGSKSLDKGGFIVLIVLIGWTDSSEEHAVCLRRGVFALKDSD